MSYILVLDDDELISQLLDILLTEEGYEVQCAPTVSQALAMVQVRQPDLVLLDMVLHPHDGAAFVRSFRELPCSRAALIAFSAMANLEDAAAKLGADGYLSKPFDIDDLLTLVAGHLGRDDGLLCTLLPSRRVTPRHDRDAWLFRPEDPP